ncbi:hypothetical protein BDB00DRAFT_867705 [Zychaea mexicana]|uniref:uncharacterized protein n=1 Tax=Zychaea mexicana TaxID=64656 RepID=UPI0022FE1E8B|nr:uncharacterized protein BDB00DRAFT_867705 [Zychaea mexicana]KAI9498050.1 hypothetical protein BDB00DRAFT_867705 [Zychaea mexicana]
MSPSEYTTASETGDRATLTGPPRPELSNDSRSSSPQETTAQTIQNAGDISDAQETVAPLDKTVCNDALSSNQRCRRTRQATSVQDGQHREGGATEGLDSIKQSKSGTWTWR